MKITKGTIIRTILLILALINQALSICGHCPIPIDNEMVSNFISLGITGVTSIMAWWKNNSFTKKAIQADTIIKGDNHNG